MDKLIYKENLYENIPLKSEKRIHHIVYLVLVFVAGLGLCLIAIFLTYIPSDKILLVAFGVFFCLLGIIERRESIRIRPLEVYEDGFIWPYYNWPKKGGFVKWEDVGTIVVNIREMPGRIFISVKNKKEMFYPLKKYALFDIERFLDIARSKGVRVIENEISFRGLGKLLEKSI